MQAFSSRSEPIPGRRCASRLLIGGLLSALLVAWSPPAQASPFDVYGFGSRATAMGGAMGAAARDHAAIFYNPANLVQRQHTHFGLALTYIDPSLHIEGGSPDSPDPMLPHRNVGIALGFNFPLGGVLDYRMAVGFAIFLPLLELTRLEAVDPGRPHFYMYQSLPDHLVIAPAIGFRIFDWLRVGVGVQILAALDSAVEVSGDIINRRMERRSLTVDLAGTTGPIAAISADAGGFEIGVTFRDQLQLDYHIPVLFEFTGVGDLLIDIGGTTLYSPRQINFALSYHLEGPDILVAADFTLALWSHAPDPSVALSAVVDDAQLRPNEDDVSTLFDIQSDPIDLAANDVLIPHFGIEWRPDDIWAVRGGFFHRPAILPDQTGYATMLDSRVNTVSIGAGATFPDPLHVADEPLTIDVHLQWTHLANRTTVKDPANGAAQDAVFESGGSIWNVGLEFRQDF